MLHRSMSGDLLYVDVCDILSTETMVTGSSKSLFLLFKKEIVCCEVDLFASLFSVTSIHVQFIFYFQLFKTILLRQ